MVVNNKTLKPVKDLEDKGLEDALNAWYQRGFATWEKKGAPGRDGEWGGSLHFINVEPRSKDRLYVYIDYGSITDRVRAVEELRGLLESSRYQISSGKVDLGDFYIRPMIK